MLNTVEVMDKLTTIIQCPRVSLKLPCQVCNYPGGKAVVKENDKLKHIDPALIIGKAGEPRLRISLLWIPDVRELF